VWAGKPVNWAFKCSAAADRHQLIVTNSVFKKVVEGNDYLTKPCYVAGHQHGGTLSALWATTWVQATGEMCLLRKDPWCAAAGEEACAAILKGEVRRDVHWRTRLAYRLG